MAAPSSDAFLLVTHGSRDPRPDVATTQLIQQLNQQAIAPSTGLSSAPLINAAALEFAPAPLHEQIVRRGRQLQSQGIERLWVVPLFLLRGVHVKEDVPQEVALAQQQLDLTLHMTPHLGQSPLMPALLEQSFAATEAAVNIEGSAEAGPPTRLLLSHGSRRSGGNQGAVALAAGLQAAIAYWSVAPSLIEKVESLVQLGQRQLVLLPYFLFPGGITDAIAQQMSELRQTHPGLHIYLAPLLSHSPGFPELVASLMQSAAMPHRPTTLTS